MNNSTDAGLIGLDPRAIQAIQDENQGAELTRMEAIWRRFRRAFWNRMSSKS